MFSANTRRTGRVADEVDVGGARRPARPGHQHRPDAAKPRSRAAARGARGARRERSGRRRRRCLAGRPAERAVHVVTSYLGVRRTRRPATGPPAPSLFGPRTILEVGHEGLPNRQRDVVARRRPDASWRRRGPEAAVVHALLAGPPSAAAISRRGSMPTPGRAVPRGAPRHTRPAGPQPTRRTSALRLPPCSRSAALIGASAGSRRAARRAPPAAGPQPLWWSEVGARRRTPGRRPARSTAAPTRARRHANSVASSRNGRCLHPDGQPAASRGAGHRRLPVKLARGERVERARATNPAMLPGCGSTCRAAGRLGRSG